MKKNFLKIIFLLFCSLTACNIVPVDDYPKSNLKTPIILISGYNNKSELWEEEKFTDYLANKKNLIYGGKLFFDANLKINSTKGDTLSKMDYFSVSFSDSTTSIDVLSIELKKFITHITEKTNTKKVMLVGYSMGGLIARQYLTENIDDHKVSTLITIASPHKGSFWANTIYASNLLLGGTDSKLIEKLSSWLGKPISGLAIAQMVQSGKESFLAKLNEKSHPDDVVYHSIIAQKSMMSNFKTILNFFDIKIPNGNSDYVVTSESQNMNYISYFKQNNINCEITKIENTHHFNVLNQHKIIYSIIEKYLKQ